MNLDTESLIEERSSRITRAGILSCFVLASAMLIATLAFAESKPSTPGSRTLTEAALSQ